MNKTELFYFLSERVSAEEFPQDKEVYVVLMYFPKVLITKCSHVTMKMLIRDWLYT